MDGCRVRRLLYTHEQLCGMLGLPGDAVVLAVVRGKTLGSVELLVQSDEYAEVARGSQVPVELVAVVTRA